MAAVSQQSTAELVGEFRGELAAVRVELAECRGWQQRQAELAGALVRQVERIADKVEALDRHTIANAGLVKTTEDHEQRLRSVEKRAIQGVTVAAIIAFVVPLLFRLLGK